MADTLRWTPFLNQAYVVLGSSLNLAQVSFALGYTAILLPQLRQPDSIIPIDDDTGSWIASTVCITLLIGNFLVAVIMDKYGRKITGLVAATAAVMAWIWIASATSSRSLLIARFLQGIDVGMVAVLSSIVTGECSCPRNRAAFTSCLMLCRSLATLSIHTLGAYLSWQTTALIASIISFVGLLILIYSPETPCWLASQGRFEECREVFQWLRGKNDEEELQKMIESIKATRDRNLARPSQSFPKDIVTNFRKFINLLIRREFYMPIIIMFHLQNMCQWCGIILLVSYTDYYYRHVVGPDVDFGLQITLLDISRLMANIFVIYLVKTIRRRVLIATIGGMNTFFIFVVAIYVYAKLNNFLSFDHNYIGILLSHLILASNVMGASTFATTISSEIYPLEFRSIAGGISAGIYAVALFTSMKTLPVIVNTYGMHVLFLIYGILTAYCLIVVLLVLPETKDKTLQEIEDELKGKNRVTCPDSNDETQLAVRLTSFDSHKS